jgi:hypothetical protein
VASGRFRLGWVEYKSKIWPVQTAQSNPTWTAVGPTLKVRIENLAPNCLSCRRIKHVIFGIEKNMASRLYVEDSCKIDRKFETSWFIHEFSLWLSSYYLWQIYDNTSRNTFNRNIPADHHLLLYHGLHWHFPSQMYISLRFSQCKNSQGSGRLGECNSRHQKEKVNGNKLI